MIEIKKSIALMIVCVFFSTTLFSQDNVISKEDSLLILKYHNEGRRLGRLGDFENSIINFQKVYLLRKKIFGENSYRLASPIINLGIQYKNQGNLNRAIECYKEAEKLYVYKFGNDYADLGPVYSNLANIYKLTGDYIKALEYENNALRILKKDSINLFENYQVSKYNIIETQFKLGNTIEAIKFAQNNIRRMTPELKARLYDLIASAYRSRHDIVLAEKNYSYAIKSWIQLYGDDNIELISEYLAYSSFLISQKKYDQALSFTRKADKIVLNFYKEKSPSYADVRSTYGDYYFYKNSEAGQMDDFRKQRKENLNKAIQYYQEAAVALIDSFQNTDPFVDLPLKNTISKIQLVEVLKKRATAMDRMADVFLSEFDDKSAIKYFKGSLKSLTSSIELIHDLQIGFESEDSKLFLSENQESTFYEAIDVAHKLYKQTKDIAFLHQAFELSERGKASVLLASIKDMKAKEFGGIPDSLLVREKILRSNIDSYTSMLFDENHTEKPDSLKVSLYSSKIFKANEELNKLLDSFEKSYPQYYALKYENKVVGVKEIQKNLNSRQALIEYFVKEPEDTNQTGDLFRFVITEDSVSFSKEVLDYSYLRNIQAVHDFLVDPNYLDTKKSDYESYSMAAFNLYKVLFENETKKLSGKSLTIIPHNKLAYIPFDALISEAPDTTAMNFSGLKYLIRDYPINYSYSATLLYNFSGNHKSASKDLIIFAPKYNYDEPRYLTENSNPLFFHPLPGAKEEVKGISGNIQGKIYSDELAQESTFKENASNFDILHLAMHTLINDSLPMFSKLVFSKPDGKSTDDGYLNTLEIYNMKLKARLAVLSACETGTGMLKKGEGVMSMARAFIYAGCPSIVMTLWKVEDKSGARIMSDFYSFLSKGKRKDVALRMAKLKHLETSDPLTAHPHFWLGYVSIGNSEPLRTSNDVYFIVLLFVIGVLVFVDWYFRRKPKIGKMKK